MKYFHPLKIIGVMTGMLAIVALANQGWGADEPNVPNHVPADYAGKPVAGTPQLIPGIIRAVDYDEAPAGPKGITFSYHNAGTKTAIRKNADSIGLAAFGRGHVSTTGQPEASEQVYVEWTESNEWLKYTVRVAEIPPAKLKFRPRLDFNPAWKFTTSGKNSTI